MAYDVISSPLMYTIGGAFTLGSADRVDSRRRPASGTRTIMAFRRAAERFSQSLSSTPLHRRPRARVSCDNTAAASSPD